MKQRLALYIEPNAVDCENARALTEWAEMCPDSYVRVSEFIEVEFPEKPGYAEEQLRIVKQRRDELIAEHEQKIGKLDDLISHLAALEYKPVDQDV